MILNAFSTMKYSVMKYWFRSFTEYRRNNGILFPKLFWLSVRKRSSAREKQLNFKADSLRICKKFEITRTIYLISESSEQFLKQNAFSTCSWSFLRSKKLEQFKFKLEKNNWDLETLDFFCLSRLYLFPPLLTLQQSS